MSRRSLHVAAALLVVAVVGACAAPPPSSSPAASPSSVQAPPNPRLVEFEEHIADAISRQGQLIRALSAASAGSQGELRLAATQMETWADEERTWLEEHRAEACYEDAASAYAAGLADIAAAASAFVVLAAASSPPTDEQGQAAGQSLASGTESIGQAAALARTARAACRAA